MRCVGVMEVSSKMEEDSRVKTTEEGEGSVDDHDEELLSEKDPATATAGSGEGAATVRQRPIPGSICGSLLRLKNKPSTFSSWDSRFLSVHPPSESLLFFSSEKDRDRHDKDKDVEPLQSLPLSKINKVQGVDQFSLQILVKGKPETVIFLRATSPEDKMRWVHHLELFLREVKVREGVRRELALLRFEFTLLVLTLIENHQTIDFRHCAVWYMYMYYLTNIQHRTHDAYIAITVLYALCNICFDWNCWLACTCTSPQSYESWLQLSQMTHEASIQEHEGYLKKLKRTPPGQSLSSSLSSWNTRYFRINPTAFTLEYFSRAPKEGKEDPKDKRSIMLSKIVDVRSIDPWTFQIEVKEDVKQEQNADEASNPRQLNKQNSSLQSGNMSYFCLQAKTQDEQAEWKSILENYLMDLMV